MVDRTDILSRIAELHHELPKLFEWSLYELPDDIQSYYISDRSHPEAKRDGYHFQLFLLRSSSFTWISIEFCDQVLDKRHVHTFPLNRIQSVRCYQFGTETGIGMGCTLEISDVEFDLPFKGDPHSLEEPAGERAFAFGKSIANHL